MTSAIVPILIGLALGERPSVVSMLGIGLALPAIAMVARERRLPGEPGRVAEPSSACGPGVGFGSYLVLLSRTDEASKMWPVLIGRGAAVLVLTSLAIKFRCPSLASTG